MKYRTLCYLSSCRNGGEKKREEERERRIYDMLKGDRDTHREREREKRYNTVGRKEVLRLKKD